MKKNLVYLIILIAGVFSAASASSQETASLGVEDFSSDISIGSHFFNVKGYRGKVGEYDVLHSGADTTFSLQGNRERNYVAITGDFFDQDDQKYAFNVDVQRIFQTAFSYKKFIHYLDHDPLENQDFATDFNPGRDNQILIEELKSGNTLRLPQLPFLTFKMDYRSYNKRGHRQATTVSKCSECHVSSQNKRVNSTTEDVAFTVAGNAGPATIQYTRLVRSFTEGAAPPVNDYGNGASFFLVKGYAPYSRVPDINNSVHEIKLSSQLPFSSSLFASYQTGEKNNRDTRNDIDYSSAAGRLSTFFFRYFSFDTFYHTYSMHNSTSQGIERDVRRGGIDISTFIKKRLNVKLSYLWENIDRDNFSVNSTNKKIYRLTANYRALRKLRLHFKYEKTKVGDPFVTKDQDFFHLVETSLPQSSDEFYCSLSWAVRQNLSLSSHVRYIKRDNDRYHVDEDRYEFSVSFWYVPIEQLTISGSYTLADNSVDTPLAYKRYHLTDPSSLFLFNDIPYDDQSQSYAVSVSYMLNRRLSLTGEVTYTRSLSEFDSSLDSASVGDLSNIKIHRLDTALGLTYLYSNRLSLYAKYLFREYNDKTNNAFDGQFNAVSIGLNYSFR